MAEVKTPDLSFAAVQKQRFERGFGAVLPRGLPAAKNRPNGAARTPVDHGRPLGARACPPGTRGSTLSLGAAAGHRRRFLYHSSIIFDSELLVKLKAQSPREVWFYVYVYVIDEYRIISQRWLNCDKEIKNNKSSLFWKKR